MDLDRAAQLAKFNQQKDDYVLKAVAGMNPDDQQKLLTDLYYSDANRKAEFASAEAYVSYMQGCLSGRIKSFEGSRVPAGR